MRKMSQIKLLHLFDAGFGLERDIEVGLLEAALRILRLSSLWRLCAASCVVGLLPSLLFGLLVAGFVVLCGGSPARWLLPPPSSVVSLRRPGPVSVLVPPSGYLVASCDGPVALPFCLGCGGALLPRFILLHGSKGLWPCVGFCITLYTMVHLFLWSSVLLH